MIIKTSPPYTLEYLATVLSARLESVAGGDSDCGKIMISGLGALQTAVKGQLTFLSNPIFAQHVQTTQASAILVADSFVTSANVVIPLLRVKNPYLCYAQVSALFDDKPAAVSGIHVSAVVDPGAKIASAVAIGPNAVIGANTSIGEGSVIAAGAVISADVVIGKNCYINSNVTLYHRVRLGDRVTIHSNTVIGSDGFGYVPKPEGGWQKIHQLGGVSIGSDVEIGASTAIDRGALEDTVIEDGVIIDNQVHIAHNVRIGKNTAIAGCVGIAGSTTIGANCTVAGAVAITGHITIADNVHISGMSMVTGSIKEAGMYSSGIPLAPTAEWRRNAVRFGQLDDLAKRVKELEKK